MNRKLTHFSDEGLVLKKNALKDSHQAVTLLTKEHGKLVLTAFGTKKLTSRRLSHLETGNVVRLSWHENGDFSTLQETDLLYAHSRIKEDAGKLDNLYLVLFVLNKLLPEKVPEENVYDKTLRFLKRMHSEEVVVSDVEDFLQHVLMQLGFLDDSQLADPHFDVMGFVEGLIGRKIKV